MRPTGIIYFFLPALVLISLLGMGAGTALANTDAAILGTADAHQFSNLASRRVRPDLIGNSLGLASTNASTGTKHRAFVGTVDSITGAMVDGITGSKVVMMLNGTGEEQTVFVAEDLEVKRLGTGVADNHEELQASERVVILSEVHGEDWIALKVVVKPDRPAHSARTLVVIETEDDLVTAVTPSGDTETFTLPEDVDEVAPGEVVTIFEEDSGEVTGLVSADEIQGRLDGFLEEAEAEDGDGNSDEDVESRSRRVQAIADAVDRFGSSHLHILNQVHERVPEHARAHIESVAARVESDLHNSRSTLERVKAKLQERDSNGNGTAGQDHRPEVGTGKPAAADGEDPIRGRPSGTEDGSGGSPDTRPDHRPAPRVADDEGATNAPAAGGQGSGAKGRNK